MAQGGEFAFVLFAAALATRVIDPAVNANMTAIVVLSMALTPLAVLALKRWGPRSAPSTEGAEAPHEQRGNVLVIGFGRFGQIASQHVLAQGADITIIDNDPQVIRDAQVYGFKVYYGDGTRDDVLHAAGAHHARAILVCIDDKNAATRITEHAKHTYPQAHVLVRAYDREHAVALAKAGADFQMRETFESAVVLGHAASLALGATPDEADALSNELRRRDAERLVLEMSGDAFAGRALILGNARKQPAHSAAPPPAH